MLELVRLASKGEGVNTLHTEETPGGEASLWIQKAAEKAMEAQKAYKAVQVNEDLKVLESSFTVRQEVEKCCP